MLNLETNTELTTKHISLQDIIGDGFLWAVPRNRRTVEKRLKRKFGHPDYIWKLYKPKTNLQVCSTCGHDHEIGILCRKFTLSIFQFNFLRTDQTEKNKRHDEIMLNNIACLVALV